MTVLIVQKTVGEDVSVEKVVKKVLVKVDFMLATDGYTALDAVKHSPIYDLVIIGTDIENKTCEKVIRRIREKSAKTKIILTSPANTAYDLLMIGLEYMPDGVVNHLNGLENLVRDLMADRMPLQTASVIPTSATHRIVPSSLRLKLPIGRPAMN
jgi:DNA-binding response OmpR family regulator